MQVRRHLESEDCLVTGRVRALRLNLRADLNRPSATLSNSALLRPRRSRTTCKNAGLHSGEPSIADKDEAAGSSPARPTTHGLSCRNARRSSPWIAAASAWAAHGGLRTHPCIARFHESDPTSGPQKSGTSPCPEQRSSVRASRIGGCCPHRTSGVAGGCQAVIEGGRTGMRTRSTVSPGRESMLIVPPWRSTTMRRAMSRPRPVPSPTSLVV